MKIADENHPMEEIHQAIEALGGQTIELPGSLWHGIDSVDAAAGDEPCEFPHPYRLDAAHAYPRRLYPGGEMDDGGKNLRPAGCCRREGSGDTPLAGMG